MTEAMHEIFQGIAVMGIMCVGVITLGVMLRDKRRHYCYDGSYLMPKDQRIRTIISDSAHARACYNDLQEDDLEDVNISEHRELLDIVESDLTLMAEEFVSLHHYSVESPEGILYARVIYQGYDYEDTKQRVFELTAKLHAPIGP